ncbi:hypothetical protein M231_03337 [Tremella mesenterica]|uniref:Uncharacterized protein n=1 Tax=Tremella mesenterica TaxID=5217 RepID=A0A4Q1BNF5_TREME|nr:hypothetical protein M231_03337 [Tremella mesenterica]
MTLQTHAVSSPPPEFGPSSTITLAPWHTVMAGMVKDTSLDDGMVLWDNSSHIIHMYGETMSFEYTVMGKASKTAGVCTITGVPKTDDVMFIFDGNSDCYAMDLADDTQGTRGVSLECLPKPTGLPCK